MSKEPTISVRAVVTVNLEIRMEQPWSGDEKAANIHKAAAASARDTVHRLIANERESGLRMTGEPRVSMIITEDPRS